MCGEVQFRRFLYIFFVKHQSYAPSAIVEQLRNKKNKRASKKNLSRSSGKISVKWTIYSTKKTISRTGKIWIFDRNLRALNSLRDKKTRNLIPLSLET